MRRERARDRNREKEKDREKESPKIESYQRHLIRMKYRTTGEYKEKHKKRKRKRRLRNSGGKRRRDCVRESPINRGKRYKENTQRG